METLGIHQAQNARSSYFYDSSQHQHHALWAGLFFVVASILLGSGFHPATTASSAEVPILVETLTGQLQAFQANDSLEVLLFRAPYYKRFCLSGLCNTMLLVRYTGKIDLLTIQPVEATVGLAVGG